MQPVRPFNIVSLDDHWQLVNCLVTIFLHREDNDEVVAIVAELVSIQLHIRGAGVSSCRGSCSVDADVLINIIQLVVRFCGIAVHAVLFTVVINGTVRAGDLHVHVDRINLLVTFSHIEGYGLEVRIDVRECALQQVHVSLADISPFCCSLAVRLGSNSVGEVLGYIVQITARCRCIAADAMFFTVIISRIALSDDGDNRIDRVDYQLTVHDHEGDILEVVVGVREVTGLQFHVVAVGVGSAHAGRSAEGKVGFSVQRCAGLDLVAGHGMLFAVVVKYVTVLGDGYRRVNLINCLVAIRHVEDDLGKVCIGVGELLGIQTHIGCAGIGPCRCCSSCFAEGEVIFSIQRAADRNIVAAHAVLFTVVRRGVLVSGNGHNHFIHRNNLLIAIGHQEVDLGEVVIGISKVVSSKPHRSLAIVGPYCRCCTGEVEIVFSVQAVADLNIIAAHTVFFAVIGRVIGSTGNGHRRFDRLDHQLTIHDGEYHVREVVIDVREVGSLQFHVIAGGIGTAHAVISAEGEVVLSVQSVVERHIITGHGMLFAVIVSFAFMLSDGHGHIDRINHQLAVHDLELNVFKIRVGVREVTGLQCHVITGGVGAAHAISSAEGEICLGIQRIVNTNIVTGHGMFCAVIVHFSAVFGDCYFRGDRVDLLVAVGHIECHRAKVRIGVGKQVLRQAHLGLAGVSPGRRGCSVELDVRIHVIQLVARCCGVAADAVVFAVIVGSIVRADHGHGHIDRFDLLITVGHFKGHGTKILIGIGKLFLRQAHSGLAGVSPFRCDCSVELDIFVNVIQLAARCCSIAADTVAFTVIIGAVVRADHGHCHIDWIDH